MIRTVAVLGLAVAAGCQTAARPVSVSTVRTSLTIPTYTWGPADINPHFEPTPVGGQMSIYPYPFQDNLGREKVDKSYEALVLENEYLRVTVLPELGGHVHSVFDKTTGRETFYLNKVIKPGMIGLAGAWISGGIEFNTGPTGHTVTAVYPVSCQFVTHADGSKSIAIGHNERIYRTQWLAEVRLRPGRRFLEERIRWFNPNPTPTWYYFWNCTAVPNTDGMEFVYPMKLGTDHACSKYFSWPVHEGKDLSRTRNYDEPTSLFAHECDQDFFGSYDHDIDFGVVAYANHHEVRGKKDWTWGRSDDAIASMATLTDDGSWYNEVQSGPLQTQGEAGVLGPHQTIEWKEWWYPVHGLDGFEFATKDVAVNVLPHVPFGGEAKEPVREIRIAPTGWFGRAVCVVSKDGREVGRWPVCLQPEEPVRVELPAGVTAPIKIEIADSDVRGPSAREGEILASFVHPLPLPDRKAPEKPAKDESPSGLWKDGLKLESQGDLKGARGKYEEAIKKQADFAPAMKSLAAMDLRSGLWEPAAKRLGRAVQVDPEDGMAHYLLAEAAMGMDDDARALEEAWKAARIESTTAMGLNLVGQVYIRQGRWDEAEQALRRALLRDGNDVSSWTLLALVFQKTGRREMAVSACRKALERDPLDPHAAAALHQLETVTLSDFTLSPRRPQTVSLPNLYKNPQGLLEAATRLYRLHQYADAAATVTLWLTYNAGLPSEQRRPVPLMLVYCLAATGSPVKPLQGESGASLDYEWPHRVEEIDMLRRVVEKDPRDERAWYLLGNVLFSKQRYDEARKAWDRAVELGLKYSVLYRNIGMAKDRLDSEFPGAVAAYEQALALNPHDQVVLRDLGRLYRQHEQWDKAVAVMEKCLGEPRPRSDVAEDLVGAYEHLGQLDKAAALLDSRSFDPFESQQSLHDLFETVHRRLGEKAMERKDYLVAIREFERSLEYPRNLNTGKPKTKSQAQCLYLLGKAYADAGKPAEARKTWQRAVDEGEKGGDFAKKAKAALTSQPAD